MELDVPLTRFVCLQWLFVNNSRKKAVDCSETFSALRLNIFTSSLEFCEPEVSRGQQRSSNLKLW